MSDNAWKEIGYNLPATAEHGTTNCTVHGEDVECLPSGSCVQCTKLRIEHQQQEELQKLADERSRLSFDQIKKRMIDADFIEDFINLDFNDFETNNDNSQQNALTIIKRYIDTPDIIKLGMGVILLGKPGVGKTMLATIITKKLLASYKSISSVQYMQYYQLNFMRYTQFDINKISKCDFLVIDEIGVSDTNSKHEVLFEALNNRYIKRKPTILISNLTKDKFNTLLSSALKSRINERMGIIEIKSVDYRSIKK